MNSKLQLRQKTLQLQNRLMFMLHMMAKQMLQLHISQSGSLATTQQRCRFWLVHSILHKQHWSTGQTTSLSQHSLPTSSLTRATSSRLTSVTPLVQQWVKSLLSQHLSTQFRASQLQTLNSIQAMQQCSHGQLTHVHSKATTSTKMVWRLTKHLSQKTHTLLKVLNTTWKVMTSRCQQFMTPVSQHCQMLLLFTWQASVQLQVMFMTSTLSIQSLVPLSWLSVLMSTAIHRSLNTQQTKPVCTKAKSSLVSMLSVSLQKVIRTKPSLSLLTTMSWQKLKTSSHTNSTIHSVRSQQLKRKLTFWLNGHGILQRWSLTSKQATSHRQNSHCQHSIHGLSQQLTHTKAHTAWSQHAKARQVHLQSSRQPLRFHSRKQRWDSM